MRFIDECAEPLCSMLVVRHADRTCKQKITLKFSGPHPPGYPLNEDIRAPCLIKSFRRVIEEYCSVCRSETSNFTYGMRRLDVGTDDLKLKIQAGEDGWLLKLKWGGNLTPLGLSQSEIAGRELRQFLPCELADLKVFASGDTRCQQTASSFLRGLLNVSDFPIRSEDGPDGLGNLDDTPFRHSSLVEQLRGDIGRTLMSGRVIDENFTCSIFPDELESVGRSSLVEIKNEFKTFASALIQLKIWIDELVSLIESLDGSKSLYANEDVSLMLSRWKHVWRSLHRVDPIRGGSASARWKSQQTVSGALFSSVQISLISEIFDNSNYDYRHNVAALEEVSLQAVDLLGKIQSLVTKLSQIVTPLEYGITKQEKAFIGCTFLHPLIRKLRFDFRLAAKLPIGEESVYLAKHEEQVDSPDPRVRLYFAHHSHVFSFVSILRSISLPPNFKCNEQVLSSVGTLGFLCQIVFNVFKHHSQSLWGINIDIFPGDDHKGTNLEIRYLRVMQALTGDPQEIDSFFSSILLLPSRDTSRSTPSHLLASIGESSADTLAQVDESDDI